MPATTQAGMARGSSAVLWKTSEWALVASKVLSPSLILGHFRHSAGGEVGVLVGNTECEPGPRKKQWDALQVKLASRKGLPLVTLLDHNSIMVQGVNSADIPRELPETVKAREREALALAKFDLEDVCVHLHGEHRDDSVSGFTFPSLQHRINRVHLSAALLPFVRSTYTVCISLDHLVVAL